MTQASVQISLGKDSPELAATYEETSVRQFEHGKILIAALDIQPGAQVLDIGTGTGRLAAYVAELVGPGGHVTGIDPLPLRIDIARGKNQGNFTSTVGRAEDLSAFADASFDVVYLNSVIHWVADKARALAEIFRVLKPGGRLGFTSGNPLRPHQFRGLVHDALITAGVALTHAQAQPNLGLDPDTLRALVAGAGFGEIGVREETLIDYHADGQSLLAWSVSSSFGNFLIDVAADEQARILTALDAALETRRTAQGIRLERYLTYLTARKPQVQ